MLLSYNSQHNADETIDNMYVDERKAVVCLIASIYFQMYDVIPKQLKCIISLIANVNSALIVEHLHFLFIRNVNKAGVIGHKINLIQLNHSNRCFSVPT